MSTFQVKIKLSKPQEEEDGMIVKYKSKRIAGLLIDPKNKLTIKEAGLQAAQFVKSNIPDKDVVVEIIGSTKLGEDFIYNR